MRVNCGKYFTLCVFTFHYLSIFCLLLHFFSTIEIETKFYKKYPAEFRNYVRCQRKSAWNVNKHFEMLSSLLDATSFGEDESEIIDAVTPKTVKFRRSFRCRCTFFPCTRYTRVREISTKICWIIDRMNNLIHSQSRPDKNGDGSEKAYLKVRLINPESSSRTRKVGKSK